MTRLIGVMWVLGALTLATAVQPADAQTARAAPGTAGRLVGAWELVSRTVRKSDGTILVDPVLGEKPLGRLYYDASGVMMLR